MKGLFLQALDVLVPPSCAICKGRLEDGDNSSALESVYARIYGHKSDDRICVRCLSKLVPQKSDKRWLLCMSEPFDGDLYPNLTMFTPFPYDGVVKRALPRLKFDGKKDIARYFGILLGQILREEGVEADLIVPVPLHPERYEERGYNQAEEIGFPASRIINIPFAGNVLLRTRNTKRQTDFKENVSRITNVQNAFCLSEEWDVNGLTIILVDDVATTGITMHEAASALLDGGAEKVLCVSFAGNRQAKNTESF